MIESILWIVFVLACVIVSAVILLQEGKGGGLGEAFGGVGQQTFGVKAEGINKFTGWVALLVVVLAITITKVRSDGSELAFAPAAPPPIDTSVTPVEPGEAAPAQEPPAQAPPAQAPPAGDGGEPAGDGK
jgi:preprotein translocase subunit SecG